MKIVSTLAALAAAAAVPKGPLPGSRVPPHKVSDHESFETLAVKYAVTAKEIMLHNFGTLYLAEVNWYLREYVGCNVPTQDKKNWRFSGTAAPGIIYISEKVAPMNPTQESAMKVIDELSIRNTPGAPRERTKREKPRNLNAVLQTAE